MIIVEEKGIVAEKLNFNKKIIVIIIITEEITEEINSTTKVGRLPLSAVLFEVTLL